jgi:hypothetical protein
VAKKKVNAPFVPGYCVFVNSDYSEYTKVFADLDKAVGYMKCWERHNPRLFELGKEYSVTTVVSVIPV